MAGMFSLMNNNHHLRVEGSQNGQMISSRDDGGSGRMTPGNRTPVMGRRTMLGRDVLNTAATPFKFNMGRDRLPRNLRRRRIEELHPILRRSVCTLIMSIILGLVGIILILVDLLLLNNKISVRGFVVFGVGFLLSVVGSIWFKHSQKVLETTKKLSEEHKIIKARAPSTKRHQAEVVNLARMTSRHTSKWPSRKNPSKENISECQVKVTSPNGNHYPEHYSFSDDAIPADRKYIITSHFQKCYTDEECSV